MPKRAIRPSARPPDERRRANGRQLRARTLPSVPANQLPPPVSDDDGGDTEDEWKPAADGLQEESSEDIAEGEEQTSSDGERLGARSDSSSGSELVGEPDRETRVDRSDWMDPRALRRNGPMRRRRDLKHLEHGLYRSALLDGVSSELELNRALLEWEAIRQRHLFDRELELGVLDPTDATPRPRRRASSASASSFDVNGDDSDTQQPEYEMDGSNFVPSATIMAKMARWPVHKSTLRSRGDEFTADESMMSLISSARRRHAPRQRSRSPRPRKARSAYAPGGPYADWRLTTADGHGERMSDGNSSDGSASSAASDTIASEFLDDGIHPDEQSAGAQAQCRALKHVYTSLLINLFDKAPWRDMPQLTYYQVPKHSLPPPEPRQPNLGWESVVSSVRQLAGVPESLADRLEDQLSAIYGRGRSPTPPPATEATPGTRARARSRTAEDGPETFPSTVRKRSASMSLPTAGQPPPPAKRNSRDSQRRYPLLNIGDDSDELVDGIMSHVGAPGYTSAAAFDSDMGLPDLPELPDLNDLPDLAGLPPPPLSPLPPL